MRRRYFGIWVAPIALVAGVLLGACNYAEASIPADLLDSIPSDVEVSLDENKLEFTDIVNTIGGDQWVVGTFTLNILTSTELGAGIVEGDLARVHASLNSAGGFDALEIALADVDNEVADSGQDADPNDGEDHPFGDELEFTGVVDTISDSDWTISGEVVNLTPETEVKGQIAVGDLVKVHAFLSDTGELTAREIEPVEDGSLSNDEFDSAEDFKFKGVVESIDGATWTVSGETFTVDADTELDEGILVGDIVEVYFFLTPDGLIIVREISLEDDFVLNTNDLDDDEDDDLDDADDAADEEDDDNSGSESHESDDD